MIINSEKITKYNDLDLKLKRFPNVWGDTFTNYMIFLKQNIPFSRMTWLSYERRYVWFKQWKLTLFAFKYKVLHSPKKHCAICFWDIIPSSPSPPGCSISSAQQANPSILEWSMHLNVILHSQTVQNTISYFLFQNIYIYKCYESPPICLDQPILKEKMEHSGNEFLHFTYS